MNTTIRQLINACELSDAVLNALGGAITDVEKCLGTVRVEAPFSSADFVLVPGLRGASDEAARVCFEISRAILAWCDERELAGDVVDQLRAEIEPKAAAYTAYVARSNDGQQPREDGGLMRTIDSGRVAWFRTIDNSELLFQLLLATEPTDLESAKLKASYLSKCMNPELPAPEMSSAQ